MLPFLSHILLFEWYVVWWGLKSIRHKNICLKEIGLCLQILLITLRYGVGIGGAPQHMKTSKPNILHIKQLKDDLRLAKEAHNTHHYIAWLRCNAQTTFSPSNNHLRQASALIIMAAMMLNKLANLNNKQRNIKHSNKWHQSPTPTIIVLINQILYSITTSWRGRRDHQPTTTHPH